VKEGSTFFSQLLHISGAIVLSSKKTFPYGSEESKLCQRPKELRLNNGTQGVLRNFQEGGPGGCQRAPAGEAQKKKKAMQVKNSTSAPEYKKGMSSGQGVAFTAILAGGKKRLQEFVFSACEK